MSDETRRRWDATAEEFQADIDLPVAVNWDGFGDVTEADLGILGDVEDKRVLELGCGGGQCSVALAERGADVVGVDFSRSQLAFARELAADRGVDVEFLLADVTDLGMFPDGAFDVAFNAFVYQWVGDLAGALAEARRVLVPGGQFAFALDHPLFRVADSETHAIEDSYFETGRRVYPDEGQDADLIVHHRTVSEVVNAVLDGGFELESLHEPGSADPDDYRHDPWGLHSPELRAKLPFSLVVDARKPP